MANETLIDVFSDIADAVRAKGVTGQMTPLQMPQKITSIPSGGETPEAEWKDVNFIDYDGKNLYSYTTAEALALTELPPAPDRTSKGLTFQEWNYTLADVKAEANASGKCTAGATYTTTDGATHLFIKLITDTDKNVTVRFYQVSGTSYVDWGDGTTPTQVDSTGSKNIQHEYSPTTYPANYTIKIVPNGDTSIISFNQPIFNHGGSYNYWDPKPSIPYNKILEKVFLGKVNSISGFIAGYTIFGGCVNLKTVTIPNSVIEIGQCAFNHCWSLQSVVIPKSVKTLSSDLFFDTSISVVSLSPYTNGSMGSTLFGDCKCLSRIDIPSTYTYINNAYMNCYSLENVIYIPNVTRLVSGAFQECKALRKVIFTNSVTIESSIFYGCIGLTEVDFSRVGSVPSLSDTSAFYNTSADLKIIVPNALYSQWKSATNWSSYADHIVMKYPSMSFKATQANSTIQLTQVGNPTSVSLEYLTTGSWTPYTIGDTITLANVGDEVYIRATSGANNKFGTDASNYHQFVMTGEIEANFSINYLLNQNGTDSTLADNSYLFYKLFSDCSALTKAPELPEATMDEACYAYMFQDTSIEDMPKMPVATLDVDCYKGMFQDNTALTTVKLEDTTMANGCYDAMFKGCSSLAEITTAYLGNFSTTYFNDWVDGVAASGTFYYNGSDTTTGPSAIPSGWTSLPIPRPELCFTAREANSTVRMAKSGSAPTVSLEYSTDGTTWSPFVVGTTTVTLANVDDKMWLRATSTNSAMAASYNSNYNYFVMTGQIAASGNINTLLNGTDPDVVTEAPQYAYPCLFQGCSALVDAIDLVLPSTTAATNSYGHGMFRNCTNLVGGPTIMATNLVNGTWVAENMFYNCSSLASVKIYATGSSWNSSCTQNWMYGVPATGTFYYNGTYTGRGASYIPTGWTITTFTP